MHAYDPELTQLLSLIRRSRPSTRLMHKEPLGSPRSQCDRNTNARRSLPRLSLHLYLDGLRVPGRGG